MPYNGRTLERQYPGHTLLGQITKDTRAELKRFWSEKEYAPNQMIIGDEDGASDVLFLLRGSARVTNVSAKGREVSFTLVEEGDCFGEFSAIDGAPRSAGVMALEPARVATVPVQSFRALLESNSDLSMAMMERLVVKLRDLTRRVSEFTAFKADDRIRLEIVRLFRNYEAPDGTALIKVPPTQAALAAFVFTNREAVAREMGRMMKKNLIERRGRALYTPSVSEVEAYQIEAAAAA